MRWRGWERGDRGGGGPGQAPTLTGRVFLGYQGEAPARQVRVTLEGRNPTPEQRQRIRRCTDLTRLQRWLQGALKLRSTSALLALSGGNLPAID